MLKNTVNNTIDIIRDKIKQAVSQEINVFNQNDIIAQNSSCQDQATVVVSNVLNDKIN